MGYCAPRRAFGVIALTLGTCAVQSYEVTQNPVAVDASVRGVVIDAGTRRPLSGATVVLAAEGTPRASTVTRRDGSFAFQQLPAGSYELRATHTTYVGGGYRQREPRGPHRSLELLAHQAVRSIVLRLWRHGIVTGAVVDDDGEPLVDVAVFALEKSFAFVPPKLVLARVKAARTNDKGEYRLSVPPGEYAVAVKGEAGSHETIYFPDSPAAVNASILSVGSDQERSGIDFRLTVHQGKSVQGTLSGGSDVKWQIELVPDARPLASDLDIIKGLVAADGRFTFANVPFGLYTLRAVSFPRGGNYHMIGRVPSLLFNPREPALPAAPQGPTYWAESSIDVDERGPARLALDAQTAGRIKGSVVFDGQSTKPAPERLVATPVYTDRSDGVMLDGVGVGRINADGTFETAGLPPGTYRLRIPGLTSWTLEAVFVGGRDSDGRISVGHTDVSGIVVRFTDKPSELSGSVTDSNGRPQPSASVLVFPESRLLWTEVAPPLQRLWHLQANESGRYRIRGLPPGRYVVVATERVPYEWRDPSFLESLTTTSGKVRIEAGATAAKDVRLER